MSFQRKILLSVCCQDKNYWILLWRLETIEKCNTVWFEYNLTRVHLEFSTTWFPMDTLDISKSIKRSTACHYSGICWSFFKVADTGCDPYVIIQCNPYVGPVDRLLNAHCQLKVDICSRSRIQNICSWDQDLLSHSQDVVFVGPIYISILLFPFGFVRCANTT